MKRSFTLIELIIVIVIMGILGTISIEILQNTFKTYSINKEFNKLSFKTDLALNVIASKLQNRIKNSVIAVECNPILDTNNSQSCLYPSNKKFISIQNLTTNNAYKYPVIEFLYVSLFSKRGMWDDNKKYIQPGWSGFVDLIVTKSGNDEYNISTPDSNFTIVEKIEKAWFKAWKVTTSNIFDENKTVLVFGGSDGRGDFLDINNSYGYYDNNATRIFKITKISDTNLSLKAITNSNSSTIYQSYYIVRGAMAIVPVYNKTTNDYNLTLRFNYFPWNGEMYLDGNSSIITTHITDFRFKEDNGVIRIYLCITSPEVKDFNLTICKEKVVF